LSIAYTFVAFGAFGMFLTGEPSCNVCACSDNQDVEEEEEDAPSWGEGAIWSIALIWWELFLSVVVKDMPRKRLKFISQ
jgi:hypothetical protein